MSPINLFKPDQVEGQDESYETLFDHNSIRIERILSPPETQTEIASQPHDEWVSVLQGSAKLELDGQVLNLHRGDQLLIPANTPHRVLSTSRHPHCLWLAVHIH
jgi:cupin 2 domain-containing protein